jgi:Sap, sulfolipid-1-addressing protein
MWWTTLLVMAMAGSLDPGRIGLTVLMLNRPRPMLQLLAFLCGGFAMGGAVGLLVLIRQATPLAATNFTVGNVQIAIGLLALLGAVVLATNISARRVIRRPLSGATVGGDAGVVVVEPTRPSGLEKLCSRARNLLLGRSVWVAGVSGLAIACPPVNYLTAMAVIVASGAAPAAKAGALITFNAVAFALVEISLLGCLVAPDKTRAAVAALHAWIRSRHRRDVAALLAAAGCFMIAVGMGAL